MEAAEYRRMILGFPKIYTSILSNSNVWVSYGCGKKYDGSTTEVPSNAIQHPYIVGKPLLLWLSSGATSGCHTMDIHVSCW